MESPSLIRVECTDCNFAQVVRDGDPEPAADVVRRHGKETGHILRLERIDCGENRSAL